MIKVINEKLEFSNANFIINLVNSNGDALCKSGNVINENNPHVDIQCRKYLKFCQKVNKEPIGTCQYVPKDSWAVGLVDCIKNNDIYNYDEPYQFIVNAFVNKEKGKNLINLTTFEKVLKNIRYKAKILKATIAIPYGIDFVGDSTKWKSIWDEIERVINNVFGDCKELTIYLCKGY